MTREEAIERFENVKANALVQKASGVSEYWQNEIDGTVEAIDMAIEALTADTVSREECNCVFSKPKIKLPKKAVEFDFSNIEVVVRCKDCRYYWGNLSEDDTDEMYGECRWDSDEMPNADDFCSYGERKHE